MAQFGGNYSSCVLQQQGALPLMVQATNCFGASPAAIHALMDFMGRGYIRIHLYHNALVDAGVLGVLAGAMQRHPGHLAFQVAGLECLLALAELHPREVVQASAHERVWACMRTFAGCAEAQEAVITLLCKLEHSHLATQHQHCLDSVDYFATLSGPAGARRSRQSCASWSARARASRARGRWGSSLSC